MKQMEIFTDGSCKNNGLPHSYGGWGYIIMTPEIEVEGYGGEKPTTNNRMEIKAVLEALSQVEEPHIITVYSDSQYVVNSINTWLDGWIKKGKIKKNMDMWFEMHEHKQKHEIKAVWVKGHNDDYYNERCDVLANLGAEDCISK